MPRLRWALAALAFLHAAPLFAQKEFGFDNRKGSGQPYLTPQESLKRLTVPPEFEAKLFAGEPDCVNPVAFTIDERGRVWVLECFEYPSKTPKGRAPRDRVVILEDTDGDGACDKRTVFAEGKDFPITPERAKEGLPAFDLATGLEVGHGGVWVGAPPYLWFIEAKDDKPGKFTPVASGFGAQDTHETLNTFQWGPDGWLYGMQGVFTQSTVKPLDGPETRMNAAVWRIHPKTHKFEIYAEGTSNPWGMDWRNTDGQFILACCVIPHLFHIVPGGVYKRQAGTSYNPYVYDPIPEISDHTFHKESGWAHAGLLSLDVPHMPERFRNSVIFGSIHGTSLKQNILKPNGSSYIASRGDDFLNSADKNFRPINLKWGPNGDIYLIDWHDQMPCHQAKADEWDYSRGRVYRIQVKGREAKKTQDIGKLRFEEVMKLAVDSQDPWTRRTALRLCHDLDGVWKEPAADRGQPGGLDRLAAVVNAERAVNGGSLGTLWAWYQVYVTQARKDNSAVQPHNMDTIQPKPGVANAAAVRGWLTRLVADAAALDPRMAGWLADQAKSEPAATARRELASAAIKLAPTFDVAPLCRSLMSHKEDAADPLIPRLTWLAYEKVLAKGDDAAAKELAWLAEQAPTNIFVRDAIVPKAMRRLASTGKPADIALCVQFLADCKDVYTREKALDGLNAALAGQTVAPPAAWDALRTQLAAEPKLTKAVAELSLRFRDPAAIKAALALAVNDKTAEPARVNALRELASAAVIDDGAFTKLVRGNAPIAVRVEAVRALAGSTAGDLAKSLLGEWKAFPRPVQAELANLFAGRKPWATAMLTAMQAGTLDRGLVTDNTITRIQGFKDAKLNALIEKAWGRTRPTPAELTTAIDAMRAELTKGTASFAKGKAVFEAQCAKCHQFEGRGQEVGPHLDGASRDIEYILANVIDPNRVIGAPYFLRIANTIDGRVEQGVLAAEDDRSITLKVENGVLKRIAKEDLDGPVKVVEKSMMPEGLTAGMTTQDFRDLVRYVMQSQYPPTVTLDGKPTPLPVTGRIPLNGDTATIAFRVTAAKPVTTQLQVGVTGDTTVSLDGKRVAAGVGDGAYPVTLPQGEHTLTVTVKKAGKAASVRLLDPDRALSYPEK
jgi:putative membrane-bound dehydrogenase-like protein